MERCFFSSYICSVTIFIVFNYAFFSFPAIKPVANNKGKVGKS